MDLLIGAIELDFRGVLHEQADRFAQHPFGRAIVMGLEDSLGRHLRMIAQPIAAFEFCASVHSGGEAEVGMFSHTRKGGR